MTRKFGLDAVEDCLIKVITDFTTDNRLQSEASSEANHKPCRDDELKDVAEKKAGPETQVTTHSSELETAVSTSSVPDGKVAKLRADLCALSAQHLKPDGMRVHEREICLDQGGSRTGHGRFRAQSDHAGG